MSESDKPQPQQITREDIEFLVDLQNEMNTQPHLCQADPRFWVVKTFEYRQATDDDEIYRVTFYDDTGDISSMTFDEALKLAHKSNIDLGGEEYAQEKLDDFCLNVDATGCIRWWYESDAKRFVEEYADAKCANVAYETREPKIAENTMFLTLREAQEHIRLNGYHYTDPYTYAMTAWRSPQVEQLYKILHEVDFQQLLEVVEDGE